MKFDRQILAFAACAAAVLLCGLFGAPPGSGEERPFAQPEQVLVRLSASQTPSPSLLCAPLLPAAPASPQPSALFLNVYDAQKKETVRMDLEDYVLCVLAGEMPASFESEALKAQAVAARSYALWKSRLFGGGGCSRGAGADVCTDSGHCMAYAEPDELHARWGGEYGRNLAAVTCAVEQTRGFVCAYDGEPIQALFHAVSGGQTEDAVAVFSNALPYLTSVESGGEESAERFEAVKTFAQKELADRLNKAFPSAKLSAEGLRSQLEVLSRSGSGRVLTLRLGDVRITGRQLRSALALNSTNFTFSFADGRVQIRTLGYGHGVGMSQVGANAMAKNGADFEAILTHYYTGVSVAQAQTLHRE